MTDWRAVVAEHGGAVWRTVYRILNHHADAADCYQDTFVAAFQAVGRQPIREWAAYLTTLATRKAIDRIRERTRRGVLFAAIGETDPADRGAHQPLEQAAAGELLDRLRSGLADLPDTQAEAFWLSAVEGLSGDEIAAQLKTSPGAVRVLLHRARTTLAPKFAATATRPRRSHE